MFYKDTLMWKEISDTPFIFAKEKQVNGATMAKLVADIKKSGVKNFVAAARGKRPCAYLFQVCT